MLEIRLKDHLRHYCRQRVVLLLNFFSILIGGSHQSEELLVLSDKLTSYVSDCLCTFFITQQCLIPI